MEYCFKNLNLNIVVIQVILKHKQTLGSSIFSGEFWTIYLDTCAYLLVLASTNFKPEYLQSCACKCLSLSSLPKYHFLKFDHYWNTHTYILYHASIIFSLVNASFWIMYRIAPKEWENPNPLNKDPDEIETAFNFSNSLWCCIAIILCQGSDILPK